MMKKLQGSHRTSNPGGPQVSDNKQELIALVKDLRSREAIRYDADIARRIGYHRSAVSEALSVNVTKPVSRTLIEKIRLAYSRELKYRLRPSDLPGKVEELEKRIEKLEAIVKKLSR